MSFVYASQRVSPPLVPGRPTDPSLDETVYGRGAPPDWTTAGSPSRNPPGTAPKTCTARTTRRRADEKRGVHVESVSEGTAVGPVTHVAPGATSRCHTTW